MMYQNDIRSQLRTADELIKSGNHEEAILLLEDLRESKLNRGERAEWARHFRRLGKNDRALRILRPALRNQINKQEPALDCELAEYGMSLVRYGATEEARSLIEQANPQKYPLSDFYMAMVQIKLWEYSKARSTLQRLLLGSDLPDYQRIICRLNLISTKLFSLDLAAAKEDLDELAEAIGRPQYKFAFSSYCSYLTQFHFYRGDFDLAAQNAQLGLESCENREILNRLFLKKWLLLAKRQLNRVSPNELGDLKKLARQYQFFEVIREVDLFEALLSRDVLALGRVFASSPYPEYQQRVLKLANVSLEDLPHEVSFGSGKKILDVPRWQWCDRDFVIKKGLPSCRLFLKLLSDRYFPPQLGNLFWVMNPGQHFQHENAKKRVESAVGNLRRILAESEFPAQIKVYKGFWRLRFHADEMTLILPCQGILEIDESIEMNLWLLFNARCSQSHLVVKDLEEILQISGSKAKRLIQFWLERGFILKDRTIGKKIYYRKISNT